MNRTVATLVSCALLLVVSLVVISAYIRLAHAGLGCDDWPACYGRIGQSASEQSAPVTPQDAYATLVAGEQEPHAWATPAHRAIAGVLGILIILINFQAWRPRSGLPKLIPLLLLALTAFLATLGIWSGGLQHPAVVLGNLVGGMTMLGLVWWLHLRTRTAAPHWQPDSALHRLALAALVIVAAQILLGGVTSARFAALACTTLPDCQGDWLPSSALFAAFDIAHPLKLNEWGVVIGGAEQQAIHITHRLGAWLAAIVVGWLAISAWRARMPATGIVLLSMLCLEIGIGVAAVMTSLPVALSSAHNAAAALLLLTVLRVLYVTRPTTT